MFTLKRVILALAVGLWLYFLLPATATAFYELYHVINFDPFYWVYGGLKTGGYYFEQWPYRGVACIAVVAILVLTPAAWQKLRGT